MNYATKALLAYLKRCPSGPLVQCSKLDDLLVKVWPFLKGTKNGGMRPEKLANRMEDVEWHPPTLSFRIERHGGTVRGSTRAEMQAWTINTSTWDACHVKQGHRQLRPMAPRLNVNPLVAEILDIIRGGREDSRVKWRNEKRDWVRVQIGAVIPSGGLKQTAADRRRRFRTRLVEALRREGWQSPRVNVFERERR